MKIRLPNWKNLCNDNLLTNSDFKSGIINQQGKSSYNTLNKYTIDMWKLVRGTLTVGSGFITINGEIMQNAYNASGQHLFAIYVASGSGSIKFDGVSTTKTLTTGLNIVSVNGTITGVHIVGTSLKVNYCKFEKGSYFTGMPLWNEALELLKCKRSYRIVKAKSKGDVIAIVPTDNEGLFQIPMDISGMIKRPSVNIKDIWTNSGGVYSQASTHSVYDDSIIFKCDTKNTTVQVYFDSTDAYIVADSYDY